jgi:multimeric flavodoxin WrbA
MNRTIVVLSGSPRKKGNTERLAQAFMEGAQSVGKTVTHFRVADMRIGGCLGCGHCFKEQGVCVQQDDMLPILEALRKADTLVLASPVYYFGVSAQLKLAIDRFFALYQEGMPVQRAALLMPCGASTDAADASIAMFRQIAEHLGWKEAGIIIAPGLHAVGEIEGRPELEQAKALGRSI